MRRITLALFAALLGALGRPIAAQATVNVAPLDPVYRQLDLLTEFGLVQHAIAGQRPYSRREIARIIKNASADWERSKVRLASGATTDPNERRARFIDELLAHLQADYAEELYALSEHLGLRHKLHLLDRVTLDLTKSNGSARQVPVENGISFIDAWVDPLTSDREGRLLFDGTVGSVETAHSFQSDHIALSATPRFVAEQLTNGVSRTRGVLQDGELRLLVLNVAIEIGRHYRVDGQGRNSGLYFSNSSPALDLIELTNDTAFTLPSFLRGLGPSRLSLFYAFIGEAQRVHPNGYMAGYKLSFSPRPTFEFGASVYTRAGGDGAPGASLSSRILDLFPYLARGAYANVIGTGNKDELSDRYAGVDFRWRFPSAHGLETFSEVLLNDFDVRRLGSVLWEDSGHILGFGLPISSDGLWSLEAEFHHTGIRFYEHHQFTSGQTLRQIITGDPLGPDAYGSYAQLIRDLGARRTISFQGAWERRRNDQYASIEDAQGHLKFIRTYVHPKETRLRAVARFEDNAPKSGLGVLFEVGIERTLNFAFVEGSSKWGALGRAGLEYRFW